MVGHRSHRLPERLRHRLGLVEGAVRRREVPLEPFRARWVADGGDGSGLDGSPEAGPDGWLTVGPGDVWAHARASFVLHGHVEVPSSWPAESTVALYLPIGTAGDFSHPEALVTVDGVVQGACDRHHQELILSPEARRPGRHPLTLRGWTGGTMKGWGARRLPPTPLVMGQGSVAEIDPAARRFVALARVALGVADELASDDPTRSALYRAVERALLTVDTRAPIDERLPATVPAALDCLQADLARLPDPGTVEVHAVGHAHIDVAWLWDVAQTRDKAVRTFHNAVRLIDRHEGFHFTQSQPQLYDFVRQDDPALFDAIAKRVDDGRWEPIGGMWVEADCNLSGAEALVRQFLYGRAFFAEHFGQAAESEVLWLPDVFGYAWNLPQLIKGAGLDYFFTIKISWNRHNRIPYDSFWWQGLDGTRVLTHFGATPSDSHPEWATYNAEARPSDVIGTWRNFQQKDLGRPGEPPPLLMAYGHGDGGGGPTGEMVENLAALAEFPGAPRVRMGRAGDFFRALEAAAGPELPTWNGELYLEYHRGTYTTQGRAKRGNRKSELLLHDAELVAAWAAVEAGFDYPREELERAWKLVCLNQFHDIIPGSSIGDVYADTARDYDTVAEIGHRVRADALDALAGRFGLGTRVMVVNPTSFPGTGVVLMDDGVGDLPRGFQFEDGAGRRLVHQVVDDGVLIQVGPVPALGLRSVAVLSDGRPGTMAEPDPGRGVTIEEEAQGFVLANGLLRVVIDRSGELTRLVDLEHDRQVMAPGRPGNAFQAFEDRPLEFDAWELDIAYEDRMWQPGPPSSVRIVETGPLRAGLEVVRPLGSSTITQRILLEADQRRVDFVTHVDWQERHTVLKVAFPVDVLATTATYDIQWGNVERPTHTNTSWDWARFETCAHKWVDLSEGDYGVSLLNDCKYGHDVHGDVLRLTLLRAPAFPDPEADRGPHRFTYSLYPHAGDWRNGTVAAAYALNDPPVVHRSPLPAPAEPAPTVGADRQPITAVGPGVIVETVKEAEDGRGIIVRLYENERRRGPVTVHTAFPLAEAERCDLLERADPDLDCAVADDGHRVGFDIGPYQIVTLRLVPAVTT